jgi:LacI family transcriptional regulator
MTVSRVINNEPGASQLTREAVSDAVRSLNYVPHQGARNLAKGIGAYIGLLYATPTGAYHSAFLLGALRAARNASVHLLLEECAAEVTEDQANAFARLTQSGANGIILPPPLCESPTVLAKLDSGVLVPVVTVGGPSRRGSLNVRIDDSAAAEVMTRHLLGLGHRRIGFISGHPRQAASAERLRGFKLALEKHGLDPSGALIEQGQFTYESGLRATLRLLGRPKPPTAIFASNDEMATAAINVAHRQGLAVPGDVSIVGFDDTSLATNIWPGLTTIRQPIADMARTAMELLVNILSGRDVRGERILEHDLVIRESSAPPKAQP